MEESLSAVKIESRKRKKNCQSSSNSNPLMGISTRSKTGMYLHRNRSGISRSDPIPSKSIPDNQSLQAFLDMKCNDASRVSSIKDLRLKRVFTPDVNSVPKEEKDEEEKIDECKKLLKGSDASRVLVTDVVEVKVEEPENPGLLKSEAEDERNDMANGLNSEDQAMYGNGSLSTSKMALTRCCRKKVFKTSSSFSYRRLLPYLMDIANDDSSVSKIEIVDGMNCKVRSTAENNYAAKTECDTPQFDDSKPLENQDIGNVHIQKGHENDMNGDDASVEEHIQTTPPDLGNTEFSHVRESMEVNKELEENQTCMGLSVDSAQSNSEALKQSPNSKCITNSVNRLVLYPCSRPRLFKNPRSISYKRLLPFLMDMSKTNSYASRNTQIPMPQVVLEEDNSMKIETENPDEKQGTENFTQDSASSMTPLPRSDGSSPDTSDVLVSPMPQSSSGNLSSNLDLQTEEILEIQTSPTNSEKGPELKDSTSPSKPSSVADSDILTKQCTSEEPESVGKQMMCLDTGLEFHNSTIVSIEKANLEQNSFQVKASSDALICPNNRHSKGILKRNRLGCRGLCNCLNCASFRLHADRAFEFSRNQMRDAEEVSSVLMNELANLRLLLEKSIIQNNGSAGIQLDPVVVKQACNKALEAEELAKERLIELNYDLNVHRRIPALLQPKVTFANNIQERTLDHSTRNSE